MKSDKEEPPRHVMVGLWVLIVMALVFALSPTHHPERGIVRAAEACWQDEMRAILHRDGSIECRP